MCKYLTKTFTMSLHNFSLSPHADSKIQVVGEKDGLRSVPFQLTVNYGSYHTTVSTINALNSLCLNIKCNDRILQQL